MAYSGAFGKRQEREPPAAAVSSPRENTPPRREDKLSGAVGALMRMKKLNGMSMETDDLILALILYLMYRESGDKDLLIMLGAMLLT